MRKIARYVHGSADSTDVDVVYVVDEIPDLQKCKEFEKENPGENVNFIVVNDGIVTQCYKGSPDEINNSLFVTYRLHRQTDELLVKRMVERNLYIKLIRSSRIILSLLSRTQYRPVIKENLGKGWSKMIYALNSINLDEIDFDNLGKNGSAVDVKKIIAFQIGQSLALARGTQLYTKRAIADLYPNLRRYLYRDVNSDIRHLKNYLNEFIEVLSEIDCMEDGPLVTFTDTNRTFDISKEK